MGGEFSQGGGLDVFTFNPAILPSCPGIWGWEQMVAVTNYPFSRCFNKLVDVRMTLCFTWARKRAIGTCYSIQGWVMITLWFWHVYLCVRSLLCVFMFVCVCVCLCESHTVCVCILHLNVSWWRHLLLIWSRVWQILDSSFCLVLALSLFPDKGSCQKKYLSSWIYGVSGCNHQSLTFPQKKNHWFN